MLDIQLGRRNLSPIQRIAVTEKYRPIYEKQAKENSLNNLKQNQTADKSNLTNREFKSTNKKLADIAGVKPTTYKMGAKVLNSDNEDLKQRVLSGETSISAGYKNGEMGNGRKKEVHNGLPTQLTLDQIAIKIISLKRVEDDING